MLDRRARQVGISIINARLSKIAQDVLAPEEMPPVAPPPAFPANPLLKFLTAEQTNKTPGTTLEAGLPKILSTPT